MSMNRSIGGLDEGDHCYFKVFKVVVCEARLILYHILNWACPRDLTQSFKDYAKNTLKMNSKRMKMFDNTMLQQMDKNPSGNQFDVSLLNSCILAACPNYEDLLIKPIKDFRNDIIHNIAVKDETKMDELIQKLRDMLVDAITKAGEVYKRSKHEINDIIQKLDENIKKIKEYPLAVSDIDTYRENIEQIRKANETVICDKGVSSLKDNFKELSNVDPASWLSGKKGLSVKMVFTRLDIIAKTLDVDSCHSIGHEDLLCELQPTEDGKKSPTIIVVEGEAGSGKSTLAKFILADWAADLDPTINGLKQYDVVLYVECKNRNISCFLDLLLTSMPQASHYMKDNDLVRSVLDMHTLVVIDGLDEMTDNCAKLLKEMTGDCVKRSTNRLNFIITTRPQKMTIIPDICGSNLWVHTRITGIPPERRMEFVERLHDEMIKSKHSKQDTSRLVDYMKMSQCRLGEHYRLPLNLTLLTYLWASDPEKVHDLTSATSLYDAVLEHLKLRVIARIREALESLESTKVIKDNVEKFTVVLFDVYLETHQSGSMQLTDECQERLKMECEKLELPFDDMCGAFFAVDRPNQWTFTDEGNQMYLSAPHKSIMEFFCAFRIFKCLISSKEDYQNCIKELEAVAKKFKHLNVSSKVKSVTEPKTLEDTIKDLLSDGKELNTIDFSHYQNVLLHLGGLMALKEIDALHQHGPELVELLQLSKVTEAQWLDLVAEAECDPQFTSLVAQNISVKLVVRDGHTGAALEIFKDLGTKLLLQIIFEQEIKYIPKIEEVLEKVSERDCSVELLLKNHWKNPQNGTSTELLEKLFEKKCFVTRFTGNLTDLKILPVDVTNLRVTIADDIQAKLICDDIAALKTQLDLKYFGNQLCQSNKINYKNISHITLFQRIHVMKNVSPDLLRPLPVVKPGKKECGSLWVSGVADDDVKRVCDIAVALLPPNMKFQSILFPRCSLSQTGFKNLLEQLKAKGVTVSTKGGVKTDSISLNKEDVINVRKLTKKAFGCEFKCGDESTVW